MNATASPSPDASSVGFFSSDQMGGFGYGIAVSVGILLLITTITLASYFCTRANTNAPPPPPARRPRGPHYDWTSAESSTDVEAPGLDEATLMSFTKVLYSEAKLQGKGGTATAATVAATTTTTTGSCCSICLADYKDSDELRLLPDCGHAFHVKCVDPWLRLHPTCPVCRTSPLPTPLPTPLAEVVPLARQA